MKRKLTLTSLALSIGLTMSGLSYAETNPRPELTDPEAQVDYGRKLWDEQNELKDKANFSEVMYWYQKAADQNYAVGERVVGVLYMTDFVPIKRDLNKALHWITKANDQNDEIAQYILGQSYMDDQTDRADDLPVKKDVKKALTLLKKSADQNFNEAQFKLGEIYDLGEIVPKNYKLSFSWHKKAAFNNHAVSQRKLGLNLFFGTGVTKNLIEAYAWYSLAAMNDTVTNDDDNRKNAVSSRDEIESKLSPEDLDEAQTLAQTYLDKINENTKE